MEWRCYRLLHAGEGPRGKHVDISCSDRAEAAEKAAKYFDDVEQLAEDFGNDEFHGCYQCIEVVCEDGCSTLHKVVCEVKRVYTAVMR